MAVPAVMDAADKDVRFWLGQIEGSQKWHKNWQERGKKVEERYLDRKDEASGAPTESQAGHKMNVLWSNVQTLQPAVYAKAATPNVQRRFRDKDPAGRWAAVVLERAEAYELDAYDDDYHYRQAILEYLLPGRGQVWVYYEPTISGGSDLRSQKLEWECCKVRHINWRDFLTNPARTWDEVNWVAKREYLTKEEAEAQRLDVSQLTFVEQAEDGCKVDQFSEGVKKAAVWEIWCKTRGKVYFVSKNSPKLLRPAEAPKLKFEGFFPCPRPLTTTTTTESILPTPDFCQYQNQADEIDRLSQRINILTKALRVAGLYDASQEDLGRLLDDTDNNVLIPCATYAVLAQQGGVEGSVSFFPLKDIIAALQQCYMSRDQAMAAMYQITGMSDIQRGASDPNETATAQQIKSQWGGLRIRDRQKEVQRFIRDTMRLKAEVHAEQFSPETLKTMSNVPLADEKTKQMLQTRQKAQEMAAQNPQQAQQLLAANPQFQALAQPLTEAEKNMLQEPSWDQVMALLRNDKLRGFRIDIETDSTIMADEAAEKQSRIEYITAMTTFVQGWGPIVMQNPKAAALAGELMVFGARAFPTAVTLEGEIEEFVEQMQKMPPQQEGGDPAAAAMVQVEAEKNQIKREEVQGNQALKAKEIDTKARVAITEKTMDLEAGAAENAQDRQQAQREGENEAVRDSQNNDAILKAIQALTIQVQDVASQQQNFAKQFGQPAV